MDQKHVFGVTSLYMTCEAKTKWHHQWKVQETGSKTRSGDVPTVSGQGDEEKLDQKTDRAASD